MISKSNFYDPLYDYVTFEEAEAGESDGLSIFRAGFGNRGDVISSKRKTKQILPFLNTVELNRLNFLRQSGLAFLVYPSATHTRFAHSIGSCYLGFMACAQITMQVEKTTKGRTGSKAREIESVRLSDWLERRGWREEFLLALLLHDVGHFPFSHTLESNFDFWASFPDPISHEDITCELIQGNSNSELFRRYQQHLHQRLQDNRPNQTKYRLVSELVAHRKHRGVDANVLCFFVSGEQKYLKNVSGAARLDLELVHHLVSGLLDLDRIDHYRRDSYYTGLKFGSNLNFAGLLGGMTFHYYVDDLQRDNQFELRLSPDAIGHALTLLHSKERLVHDCFDHPVNIAYDAMLHQAINLYLGINFLEVRPMDHEQVEKAYELFFLTDDALLSKLTNESDERVREIIIRICNRRPYTYLGKGKLKPKKHSLNNLRREVLDETQCDQDDIVIRAAKHYGSRKVPTEEWMHLHYLFDEKGVNLAEDRDYEEQIRYFERVQDQDRSVVWFFTPDPSKAEKLRTAIQGKVERYAQ